jgi:hypothetical protein
MMVRTNLNGVLGVGWFLRFAITSVGASSSNILELSYTNHLTSTITSSRIQSFINHHLSSDNSNHKLLIDISNSNLGDTIGLECINETSSQLSDMDRNSTRTEYHNETRAQIGIDLILHSNRLTPLQVTSFLNNICDTDKWNDALLNKTNNITIIKYPIFWRSLDFSWNWLYRSANSKSQIKSFHLALQNILVHRNSKIEDLHLNCCGLGPATCRALAKALMNRFETFESINGNESSSVIHRPPVSLYLSNNRDIGDSGAAAMAAAIRSIVDRRDTPVLDTLDLSGCDIGDIGIEAFALAFEDAVAPVMIRRLLLCHNRISDQGALALGRVLHRNVDGSELHIDLSNNPSVTDRGISNLILRSCSIQADGAELVGKALRSIALSSQRGNRTVEIDLSGNPIGILRGKTDKGKMYSAGAIKSKASATASAYVSQGLSFLKKGLGTVGVSLGPESDDEEEEQQQASDAVDESDKGKNMRCGFKSLANAFIAYEKDVHPEEEPVDAVKNVALGLRRTFCDTAGADALAAMIMATKDQYQGLNLKFELDLNPVVEDDMVNALYGHDDEILIEMADRHNEAMEVLRQVHERAVTAAKVVETRRRQAVAASSQFDPYDYDDYESRDESYDDQDDESEFEDGTWEDNDDYYDDSEEY